MLGGFGKAGGASVSSDSGAWWGAGGVVWGQGGRGGERGETCEVPGGAVEADCEGGGEAGRRW